jgi:hypothetical protein
MARAALREHAAWRENPHRIHFQVPSSEHPIGKHYGAIIGKLDRSRFEATAFRFDQTVGAPSGEDTG